MVTGDGGPADQRADGGVPPPGSPPGSGPAPTPWAAGDPHAPPAGTTPSGSGPAPGVGAAPGAWGPTAGPSATGTAPPSGAAGPTGSMPPPAPGAGGPQVGPRTDGVAIAALVTGIIGVCAPLGAILGVVSLGRIRRSGGQRTGKGLAIAGILVSLLWIAGGATLAVGVSQGWFQHHNVDDWPSGEERAIAEVIDSLEADFRDGDADGMCSHFIPEARAAIESEPEGCDALTEGRSWFYVPDSVIQDIRIDGASAEVTVEEADDLYTAYLVQVDGEWRLVDLVF